MKIGIVRNQNPTKKPRSPIVANVLPPIESSENAGPGTVNDNYIIIGAARDIVTLAGDLVGL
jgi:hypothetical protein